MEPAAAMPGTQKPEGVGESVSAAVTRGGGRTLSAARDRRAATALVV